MQAAGQARRWFGELPRWLRAVAGALAVGLGGVLIFRPTTSLGVLAVLIGSGLILAGVLELAGPAVAPRAGTWELVAPVVCVLAGGFVLAWPGLTVRAVALAVAAALLAGGVGSIISGTRGGAPADSRRAAVLLGLAGVLFGVLALAWPDITLFVVGVVFGARLLVAGGLTAWQALRGSQQRPPDGAPAIPARRWPRTLGAALALVVALALAAVSVGLHRWTPVVDEFYAPPREVPALPGGLIRAEAFTRGVPDTALAWRILHTTTNADGSPAVASALVVVPRHGDGQWPVIEWTHGTTGFAEQCAPSLLAEPFESGALLVLPEIIAQGWALVATDYIGLGTAGPHPYLIGVPSAHAALDAVRAARALPDARLGGQTVAWGHSQGGGAALWTGALAKAYAPDVPLAGVAAMAPASNPEVLVANLPKVTGGSIFGAYAVAGYTGLYPDVTFREYIRPGAEVTVRELAGRCLSGPDALASVLVVLGLSRDPEIFARPATEGAFGRRLQENTPPPTIGSPVLIAQGDADGIVTSASQDEFVDQLCAAGQPLDYRTYAGLGHMPLVEPDSPLIRHLLEWTAARFAGDPVAAGCARSRR